MKFASELESQKHLNIFSLYFCYPTFISSGTFLSKLQKGFVELHRLPSEIIIANNN